MVRRAVPCALPASDRASLPLWLCRRLGALGRVRGWRQPMLRRCAGIELNPASGVGPATTSRPHHRPPPDPRLDDPGGAADQVESAWLGPKRARA